jgi:hypothetical protein
VPLFTFVSSDRRRYHDYPIQARTFLVFLVGIFIVVAVLIEISVLRYAYLRISMSSRFALSSCWSNRAAP